MSIDMDPFSSMGTKTEPQIALMAQGDRPKRVVLVDCITLWLTRHPREAERKLTQA